MRSRRLATALGRGLVALALGLGALGLAGCGADPSGPGVATAGRGGGGAQPSTSGAPVDRDEALRKFAQCMRDNGVDVPDPEAGGGGVRIRQGAGGRLPDRDEKFQQAMEKCRPLLPNGGVPPTLSPEEFEQQRKFAQCMREHGVDFPDPDPATGRVRIQPSPGGRLDPDSEPFRSAMQACQHLRPSFGARR